MFRVQQLGQFYHGAAVASLLREAMLLAGLELKLPGWCALQTTQLASAKEKRVLQKIGEMSVSCAAERLFSAAFLQLLSCRRDAIRKHLSGQKEKRWQNPTRGGNRTGDFSQLYLECTPFDFQALAAALEHTRPGLMEDAVRAWRSKQGGA